MREQRAAMRFVKVIPVSIETEDYGEYGAIARNISSGGMLIETCSPMPLGSQIRVPFQIPDWHAVVTARAEVKNHYALNWQGGGHARGMGVRFLEFLDDGGDLLRLSLTRFRTLH